MKLLSIPVVLLLSVLPLTIDSHMSTQRRVEQMVKSYLSKYGDYMAVYFSEIDTAFKTLEEEETYQQLVHKLTSYQDSTIMFSQSDSDRANSYYELYKKLNLSKDSMRTHYRPRPLGYFVIHHFQFDGDPWTDSFIVDFGFRNIIKIERTIE